MSHQLRYEDYKVGWICALPIELTAARAMLDKEHDDLERDLNDNDENLYVLGSIGGHNIAIVCLPAGRIGNNPAATVAIQLRATFKSIRFGLMVGIGGGVPSLEADPGNPEADVRLGDVVVSQPHLDYGGVIQYDFGKATPSGFQRTGFLNSPPTMLLHAVNKLQSNRLMGKTRLAEHIKLPVFTRKSAGPDVLFKEDYKHEKGPTCKSCSVDKQIIREPRTSEEPVIHYGTIASGNQVIKDAVERNNVSKEFGGVLCFEMEAAGLMNSFPCLVIRGICDYADSHKNKKWQPYAAATAAAYAKEVLSMIPPAEVTKTLPTITFDQEGEQGRGKFAEVPTTNNYCRTNKPKAATVTEAFFNDLRNNNQCFRCGTPGHMERECYASMETVRRFRWDYGKRKAATVTEAFLDNLRNNNQCFRCGTPGHMERECYASMETVRRFRLEYDLCLRCGLSGHISKDRLCPDQVA